MKTNKQDKAASGALKRIFFHYYRGRGHLAAYLWNRVRWHIYPKLYWPGRYPDHVDLELSSICNMRCPMCYTTTDEFKSTVVKGLMEFDLFCKIIDELAENHVYSIRLSWRGEPTMNRHYVDCVRYARKKGIKEISSLTNALSLTTEMFAELVDLRMDWLTISFDGVGETYENIRKPARYEEMVEKIRSFWLIKQKKGSVKPVLRIQGVWPAVRENPELFFGTFEPISDEISVNALLDYLHNDEAIAFLEDFVCPVPFQRLVIGSDGRAFMCIGDELGSRVIGDANTQSIGRIWTGKAMGQVREIHKRHEAVELLDPCKVCYQPRKTWMNTYEVAGRVLQLEELVGRKERIGT